MPLHNRFTIICSLLLALGAGAARADGPVVRENISRVGRWAYGPTYGVATRNDTVFVPTGAVLLLVTATDLVEIGSVEIPSAIHSLALNGNTAILGTDDNGIHVIDFSAPQAPTLAGSLALDGDITAIRMHGDVAWLAIGGDGIAGVDVSDPAAPLVTAAWDEHGAITNLCIRGDTLFATDYSGYIHIYDISIPTNPLLVHSVSSNDNDPLRGVTVDGEHLYYTDAFSGFGIVDISTPTAPVPLDFILLDDDGYDVIVEGGLAYVAATREGLLIYDVQDPASVSFVGKLDPYPGESNYSYRLAKGGSYLYMADHTKGVDVINVTDPAAPQHVCIYHSTNINCDIAWYDHHVFVPDNYFGLRAVSMEDPTNPVLVDEVPLNGYPFQIEITGNLAVVSAQNGGIHVLDVSDPANMTLVGTYATGLNYTCLTVADNEQVYVCCDDGTIQALDISGPGDPVLVASVAGPPNLSNLYASGNRLYAVVSQPEYIFIFDISTPTAITSIGLFNNNGQLWEGEPVDVCARGDLLYVAMDWGGLDILNVSIPSAIVRVGHYYVAGDCYSVRLNGHHVFATSTSNGLEMIDVSNPAAPALVGQYWTGGTTQRLVFGGGYVLTSDFDVGFTILSPDLIIGTTLENFTAQRTPAGVQVAWRVNATREPLSLKLTRSSDDGAWADIATGLMTDGEFVDHDAPVGGTVYRLDMLAATGVWTLGETRLPAREPAIYATLKAPTPNPFNPTVDLEFWLPQPAHAKLDIHDSRGRLIRRLADESLGDGTHLRTWDGKDHGGRPMPSGLYLARLKTGDRIQTRKLTLAR